VVREDPGGSCPLATSACLPDATVATAGEVTGVVVPSPALYLNLRGWDLATGEVAPAFFAWVRDPRFVEIDASGPRGTDWSTAIRVAIGLHHLTLAAIAETRHGVRLRYVPTEPLPGGLAVAFFAVGPDDALDQPHTPFAISRIRWR
jgi:hypothetical protein